MFHRKAVEAEKGLLQCFAQERRTFDEFEHYIAESVALKPRAHTQADTCAYRFRTSCQNALLFDFNAAREAGVESRLWDAHLKVNNRFRKQLIRVSPPECPLVEMM